MSGESDPDPGPPAQPAPLAVVPDSPPEGEPVTEALAETAAQIEQIDVDAPRVAIVVAEREDLLILERAETELEGRGITSEVRVMAGAESSEGAWAERPIVEYAENAQLRGIRAIIAAAGPREPLPALISAHSELPVIGVPLTSRGAQTGSLDALLSERADDPVAWVALDDALNAAVLAARILGT
jgi:5-(carboxyamino)imidazole ribonucleotide mutase